MTLRLGMFAMGVLLFCVSVRLLESNLSGRGRVDYTGWFLCIASGLIMSVAALPDLLGIF